MADKEELEALKRAKKIQRTQFTKSAKHFEEVLANADAMLEDKVIAFQLLEERKTDLDNTQTQFLATCMKSVEFSDKDIETEVQLHDEYREILLKAKSKYIKLISSPAPERSDSVLSAPVSQITSQIANKPFKRPILEIPKFNGAIHEWIPFWSHFKKYHDDPSIPDEDKLDYKKSAMGEGSKAEDLIRGFPTCKDNYKKALNQLTKRFGRNKLLIQYYIRELLSITVHNATHKDKRISVATIFDRTSAHVRALETLGVSPDKWAMVLTPLVESSLPQETLWAWQRSPLYESKIPEGEDDENADNDLLRLMEFLEKEVEGEENVNMAFTGFSTGFGTPPREKPKKIEKKKVQTSEDIPTASALLTSEQKRKTCIFCTREHENADCEEAKKLSYERRVEIVKQNKCCFKCIKHHNVRFCKVRIKCTWCGYNHSI